MKEQHLTQPHARRRRSTLASAALLGALLAAPVTAAGETMYVSDELLITFRTQPSTRGEILRNLSSGTAVEVLEMPAEGEWARVRLGSGREGWVRKQYLQAQPVARDQLAAANREVEQLTRTVAELRERLNTVQAARSEAEQSTENLDERVNTLTRELAEIRRVSASAMAQVCRARQRARPPSARRTSQAPMAAPK